MTKIAVSQGFAPILPPKGRASALILGSLPSAASLQKKEYYGHRRNAFWTIMMRLTQGDLNWPYAQKKSHLQRCGLAVWDVLATARRKGSLDSAIERDSERANPIAELLSTEKTIELIIANGGAAGALFRRHIKTLKPPLVILPSTSPANARLTVEQKFSRWQEALSPLLEKSAQRLERN